jgi:hypothetical protein
VKPVGLSEKRDYLKEEINELETKKVTETYIEA